ncbi:MAG: hypothetical protein ABFE07_29600 [Armatimonadia bacterium]
MSLGVSGNWWGAGSGGGVGILDALINAEQPTYLVGASVPLTVGFRLDSSVSGAAVKAELYDQDDELLATPIDTTASFVARQWQNFSATLAGLGLGKYYVTSSISGGAPNVAGPQVSYCRFEVLPITSLAFGCDIQTDREAYRTGEAMTVSFDDYTNMAMTVWITSYIAARGSEVPLVTLLADYVPLGVGHNRFTLPVPELPLPPGQYYIGGTAALAEDQDPFVTVRRCQFLVVPVESSFTPGAGGVRSWAEQTDERSAVIRLRTGVTQ